MEKLTNKMSPKSEGRQARLSNFKEGFWNFFTNADTHKIIEEFQESRQQGIENIQEMKSYIADKKEEIKVTNKRHDSEFRNSKKN